MANKINTVFDKIYAEDTLKETTKEFLQLEIEKRNQMKNSLRIKQLIIICATLLLFLSIGSYSYRLYYTPVAYVDMDVNPSIELVVNRFNRVIDVVPYNDDGETILEDTHVLHKNYDTVVQVLLDAMLLGGYLNSEGLVSVTVQSQNEQREHALLGSLQDTISSVLMEHCSEAITDVYAVSEEVRVCAYAYGVSPAKYLAISELQTVDPSVTYESCVGHSIGEIKGFTEEQGGHHHGGSSEAESLNENNKNGTHGGGHGRKNHQ